MNIFYSKSEQRARAWIRIPMFFFTSFIYLAIMQGVPLGGMEFLLSAGGIYLIFYVMFIYVDRRPNTNQAGLRLSSAWWKEFGLGIAIGFVAMLAIFLFELWTDNLIIMGGVWDNALGGEWMIPVLVFLVQMVSVGFYEELMSRAYLITNFKEGFTIGTISPRLATVLAVLFSSALFGIMHAENRNVTDFAILNIMLAGIMLAIPYVLTGRLAYSIGLHISWNFFQGGVFGFRVSGIPVRGSIIQIHQTGEAFWTGGAFGPEGGFIGTIAIVLICVAVIVLEKFRQGKLEMHPFFHQSFAQICENNKEIG